MGKNSQTFEKRYPVAAEQYQKARERLAQGDAEDTLTAARKSLESVVKEFCRKCGLGTSDEKRETTLLNMIDALQEAGFLTQEETGILHQTRKLCNRGAHVGEVAPDLADAQEAVDLLSQVLDILRAKDDEAAFARVSRETNRAMVDPDYYNPGRRYRGMWSDCYTREELMSFPEYGKLKRRADQGDVAAMLDLAVGFLEKKPFWNSKQLVCMRPYRYRGEEKSNNNAFDARYYYWIMKACRTAVARRENGEDYPKKYMATAFLEALKFQVYTSDPQLYSKCYITKYWEDRQSACYKDESDQFDLAGKLFDDPSPIDAANCMGKGQYTGLAHECLLEVLRLIQEAGTCDILSPLHPEHSETELKYLLYCFCCYWTVKWYRDQAACRRLWLTEREAIRPEDAGKNVAPQLLRPYIKQGVCGRHWESFAGRLESEYIQQVEEEAKRQERRRKKMERRKYEQEHPEEAAAEREKRRHRAERAARAKEKKKQLAKQDAERKLAEKRAAEQAAEEKRKRESSEFSWMMAKVGLFFVVVGEIYVFLKVLHNRNLFKAFIAMLVIGEIDLNVWTALQECPTEMPAAGILRRIQFFTTLLLPVLIFGIVVRGTHSGLGAFLAAVLSVIIIEGLKMITGEK